jgi:hypothetical protein
MGTIFRRPSAIRLLPEEPEPRIDRERVMLMAERKVARGTIAWAMGCSVSVVDSVIYEESGVPSPDDPTPEQIEAVCIQLQQSWSEEQRDLAKRLQPRLSSPLVTPRVRWRKRPERVDRAVIAERRRPRKTVAAIAQRSAAVNALLSRLNDGLPACPEASQQISPDGSTECEPSTASCTAESTSTQGQRQPEAAPCSASSTPHEPRPAIPRSCMTC